MTPPLDVDSAVRQQARGADLVDIVRALLLLQGAILVANTLEAVVFAFAFSGGVTPTVLVTAAAAVTVLVVRARLNARAAAPRALYVVEGLLIASFVIDTVLALVLTQAAVPPVAVLTRFLLPVSVVVLLRRIARASRTDTTTLGMAA